MKLKILISLVFVIHFNLPAQWVQSINGLGDLSDGALYSDSGILWAGGTFKVYKSTDFGDNWIESSAGLPSVTTFYAIARSGNNLIAGGNHSGIWISSDNGDNWTQTTSGLNNDEYVWSIFVDDNMVYASIGDPPAVGISTDNGATWLKSTNGLPTSGYMRGVTKLGNDLFAIHGTLTLYTSTDNGGSWTHLLTAIGGQEKDAIFTMGSNLCVGTTTGIFFSSDSGLNWTQVLNSQYMTGFNKNGAALFGVGDFPYISLDNGATWNIVDSEGLPGSIFNSIQFAGSYAFVNEYGSGVYRRLLSEITGIDENSIKDLPEYFLLGQNYPNPFNPTTKINYNIPTSDFVSLKVYDVLGNEIVTLVNEYKPAGRHEINFDASRLSSGVYFYKLQVGSFLSTKKMILIK